MVPAPKRDSEPPPEPSIEEQPGAEVVTIAASPLAAHAGERIADEYELIEHYGAGPLGDTYRAEDATGAEVALKVIAHELVPTAGERRAMVSSLGVLCRAQRSDALALPTRVGEHESRVYVVAPWVRGRSLRRVLAAYRDAGKTVPPGESLGIIECVVATLNELHRHFAHGALYPESVQLTLDGRVVLTDVGLVSAVKRGRVVDHFERFPDVMPYLSPDVRGGKAPSAASDLYALGALSSELLTGNPASGFTRTAGAVLPGFPPEVPRALEELGALRAAERASALPMLLEGLRAHIEKRAMPPTRLPAREGRTELMPAVTVPKKPRPPRG